MRGDVGPRSDGTLVPRRLPCPAALLRFASDERLVGQLRAGSDPAFEVLFDRHHRPLLQFCRHMLGSTEDAEDAVQDTFVAAYHGITGSPRPIVLRPWLYTIARHRCISIMRARHEHPVAEVPEAATSHLAAELAVRDDLRALLTDVRRLPENQRVALVLAELGDLSHDQIAHVVGCRQEKVRALVFQARSTLAAARAARETPCREIREHIATPNGGPLGRGLIRRHIAACEGCRDFRERVRSQRRNLALALDVVPSLGLKGAVLAAIGVGGGAGGLSAGSLLGGSIAASSLVTAALLGGMGSGLSPVRPNEPAPSTSRASPAPSVVATRDRRTPKVRSNRPRETQPVGGGRLPSGGASPLGDVAASDSAGRAAQPDRDVRDERPDAAARFSLPDEGPGRSPGAPGDEPSGAPSAPVVEFDSENDAPTAGDDRDDGGDDSRPDGGVEEPSDAREERDPRDDEASERAGRKDRRGNAGARNRDEPDNRDEPAERDEPEYGDRQDKPERGDKPERRDKSGRGDRRDNRDEQTYPASQDTPEQPDPPERSERPPDEEDRTGSRQRRGRGR